MAIRRKIIRVPVGNVQRICTDLGVGKSAVYNALAYNSLSASAQLIRKKAMSDYGGVETYKIIFA